MTTIRVAVMALAATCILGGTGVARAHDLEAQVAEDRGPPPAPVHVYGLVGLGLIELAHAELGAFVGPHVSVEGMVAWDGVYDARYGGGAYYTFGRAQGRRPPRHGLLIGARLMLDSGARFETHGDDLSSYGVIPVGYSFLSDRGFFLRATIGLAFARERTHPDPKVSLVEHHWSAGGPLFTVGAGFAF